MIKLFTGIALCFAGMPWFGAPLAALGLIETPCRRNVRASTEPPPAPAPKREYQHEPWEQMGLTGFRVFLENDVMTPRERHDWLNNPERLHMSVITWFRLRRGLTSEQMRRFARLHS